jgi:hypothetical protein
MPCHLKEFSKAVFLFRYHQNPRVLKQTEHRKKERKIIKKKEREEKKEKEKLQESLKIKGVVNILIGKKYCNFKILFVWAHFLILHHTISKTLSKIIWENFAALFRPSFHLSIYMTWVVSFVFTNELHIFWLLRVGWKRNICWAKVRKHTPKRVPECLMLRNHNIIVTIFSSIDFKKGLSRRDTDERFHLSTAQDKVKNSTKAPWEK